LEVVEEMRRLRRDSKLYNELINLNANQIISCIARDTLNLLKETGRKGYIMRLDNTLPSIVLAALMVKSVGSDSVNLLYFIRGRRYKIPKDLSRLIDFLGVNYSVIDIESIAGTVSTYLSGFINILKEDVEDVISILTLKAYSENMNLLVAGEIEKSRWMTGAFNPLYVKGVDFLPLTKIYMSQLLYIARELHLSQFIRSAKEPREWTNLKTEIGIENNELLDTILYGIDRKKTDEEIYNDVKVASLEVISKLRKKVDDSFYTRNAPIVLE